MELLWYYEDYLSFPYGASEDRAQKVRSMMCRRGEELFQSVFSEGKASDYFKEAVSEGLNECELVIISKDPFILNLPWELMYHPEMKFLAPTLGGIYRSRSDEMSARRTSFRAKDEYRVLLVICRPHGEKDIAFRTIGRILMEKFKKSSHINLDVLRPPTFDQFTRVLSASKGRYQIVHFDGHGTFNPLSKTRGSTYGDGRGEGILVFEDADGKEDLVPAEKLGNLLMSAGVPLFVLNACKSGMEGTAEGAFSSVGAALLQTGALGVVAMRHSIHKDGAVCFMERFYESLLGGATVSRALASGRAHMMAEAKRMSPKGPIELMDWPVPILYQQDEFRITCDPESATPQERFKRKFDAASSGKSEEREKDAVAVPSAGIPPEGKYGFVGRDAEFLELERSLQRNFLTLLRGTAGVGKTTLAGEFGSGEGGIAEGIV
jgi:hypothetical protein